MAIPREPEGVTSSTPKGLRRDYTRAPQITKAYLLGVLHDATERKNTYRIATNHLGFAKILCKGVYKLGRRVWFYKEGKDRNVWVVEFSKTFLNNTKVVSKQDKIDYARGYFDAEGGIAKDPKVRFYIYLAQKDKSDLLELKDYLEELGIICGKLHNPSVKVDPDYWRFFVSSRSYSNFAYKIGSYHPVKIRILRKKI